MSNRFGTTSNMVIQEVEENGMPLLLAIDAKGLYLTRKALLDTQLADPGRFGVREGMPQRLAALGLDYAALFSENKHLIQVETSDAKKKVNPLKASKRAMKSA